MDFILGKDLMIWLSGETLACATSCKLDVKAATIDTSNKDAGKWTDNLPGKLSWTMSSDNLFTVADYQKILDALIARQTVEVQFSTLADADKNLDGKPASLGWTKAANGYKGNAIITSVSSTAGDNAIATYNIELTGKGALTKVTA